ncbi:MAG: hypothetical protein HY759_04545 [Nitrospirae bacterium]|nr:hypothetical protein [Nitrospirota bacterium]
MKRLILLIVCSITLLILTPAGAEDISLHGFLQGNYSADLDRSNPDGGDFKWAEERLQLKLEADREPLRLFFKTDAFYDHVDEGADLEMREGYVDFTSSKWDLRIGRQVITWGVGDLIFINDVFPKDYEAFFSGRPMEYLKKGVDGIKMGVYPSAVSAEVIVIPFFEPNVYPDGNRFYMFDPMPAVTNREEREPSSSLDHTETALRIYRDIAGFDTSLYYYRGFFRQSAMHPDSMSSTTKMDLFYPELSVYGASAQGRALSGVLSVEAGYYDSRQDESGTDPMIANSQSKILFGYQRQIWEDFTMGLQYYAEYMHDYSEYERNIPAGFPQERKLQQLTSARVTQFLMHQTLRLSFFSFYSTSDGDYLLNPEIKYNLSDNIWAAIGANIFGGGDEWSRFGQLEKNDNLYTQMRYEF